MTCCRSPFTCLSAHSPMFSGLRGLGLAIALVLLLAFIERPSSLSSSSDPRYRSLSWEPPCGLTEGIEMVCLAMFSLDLAVKVNTRPTWETLTWSQTFCFLHIYPFGLLLCPQSYLIGWEEFRKSKWLIGYCVVIFASVIDWMLSVSMLCDEVCY